MKDASPFRTWYEAACSMAPQTSNGIPLIECDHLDLATANAAALIVVLADIIEATCAPMPQAVPETHAQAA